MCFYYGCLKLIVGVKLPMSKIVTSAASLRPRISAHLCLNMSMKDPETMQIEVRVASSEPRNISSNNF